MDTEYMRQELKKRLSEAEKVLVGIGGEWRGTDEKRRDEVKRAAAALKGMLAGKDFFLITTLTGEDLEVLEPEKKHTAAPLDVSLTEEGWEAYLRWLSLTLNKRTLLLELGEDFSHPSLIRWPFEKTAALNQKAYLYRVHKSLCQIPDELKEKAGPVKEDSVRFLLELFQEEKPL